MLEIFSNLARSVFGKNHVADDKNQYIEIVGNGLDAEHPRNARTLDIAGNEVLAGRLTVGAEPEGDHDVATKKYVDDNSGGLPSVTSDDNGDVLTVVEGAWAKAAPSGGGVVFLPVEIVGDYDSFIIPSLDTITGYLDAGSLPAIRIAYVSACEDVMLLSQHGYSEDLNSYYAMFAWYDDILGAINYKNFMASTTTADMVSY